MVFAAMQQLMIFEKAYGGGVQQYCENARKLLAVRARSHSLAATRMRAAFDHVMG